jgi:hypothetical protein
MYEAERPGQFTYSLHMEITNGFPMLFIYLFLQTML